MADKKQFGESKILRLERRTESEPVGQTDERFGRQTSDGNACVECEALLTDAVDGLLTAEEQARFNGHVATCEVCGERLAEARRGSAWLEILRTPAPEPPVDLLQRILAETGEMQAACAEAPRVALVAKSEVAPFRDRLRRRLAALLQASPLGQIAIQPRLVMTAAMAFFSIALTLNLTSIRLQDLRLSELQAGSLQRDFFQTEARAAQFITGMRAVHEMESRVRDLQGDDENVAPSLFAPDHMQPSPDRSSPAQPSGQHPLTRPEARPGAKQSEPNSGTSWREEIDRRRPLVAGGSERRLGNSTQERQEGDWV